MEFTLGQIISVSHDKLMCDISGVYRILNFLTNDNLFTHQLPRACRECKPWLLYRHKWLREIDLSTVNSNNWQEVLSKLEDKYGSRFELERIPRDDHDYNNPLTELEEMVGKEKVIVIKVDRNGK